MGQGSAEGWAGYALYKALRFGVKWGQDCYNLSGLNSSLPRKERVFCFVLFCSRSHPKVSFKLALFLSEPTEFPVCIPQEKRAGSLGSQEDRMNKEGRTQIQTDLDPS